LSKDKISVRVKSEILEFDYRQIVSRKTAYSQTGVIRYKFGLFA